MCVWGRRRKRMAMAPKANPSALWIACGLLVHTRWICGCVRPSASRRHDLRLDGLVFRVGDEPGVQQLLGLLQAPPRIAVARPAHGRRSGRPLDPAGSRPQFLELADPALLAPRLVLGLADAVHRLRLLPAQSLKLDPL